MCAVTKNPLQKQAYELLAVYSRFLDSVAQTQERKGMRFIVGQTVPKTKSSEILPVQGICCHSSALTRIHIIGK